MSGISIRATARGAVCAWMLVASSVAGSTTLFEDDFANGVVDDSTSIGGFWSNGTDSSDATSIAESGGTLTITVGSNDGSNESNYSYGRMSSALSPSFNFFSAPRAFKVRGVSFDDHGTGIATDAQRFRFWLGPDGTTPYGADDAIVVRATPDGKIRLGKKENEPSSNSDGDLVEEITGLATDDTYGFDLMLAYCSPTTLLYRLEAYTGASPTSQDIAIGTLSISANAWGSGARDSKIGIHVQEGNVSGGNQYFSTTTDSVTVVSPDTTDANLLTNPGFEDGTTDWSSFSATLIEETTTVRSGSKAGRITDRDATWKSIRRDLESILVENATYRMGIWARLGSGPTDDALLRLKLNDANGDSWTGLDTQSLASNSWTYLEGDYTYTYTAPVTYLRLYVPNIAVGIDMLFDDASVVYLVPPMSWSSETTVTITNTAASAVAEVDAVAATDVVLVWGLSDLGTGSTNDWPNRLSLGAQGPGSVTGLVSSLESRTAYTWRLFGLNEATNAWSAAVTFTSDFPRTIGSLESKDSIVGRRQVNGAAFGYYTDAANGLSGPGGSNGSQNRVDRNPVLGFELPSLPVGCTVTSAILNYVITDVRDDTNDDPALDVYLLNTANPDSTGTNFFFHGASDPDTDNKLVGSSYIVADTTASGTFSQSYTMTGAALTLLQSFYGGDNVPEQSEAFFRFNLDITMPALNLGFDRYSIDVSDGQASLEIVQTMPEIQATIFIFR